MVTVAMKNRLVQAYLQIRENGIVDIGLQSALGVGVKPANYIMVPESCMKNVTLTGDGDLTAQVASASNAASGVRIVDANPIVVHSGRDSFRYDNVDYTNVAQATLS